MQEVPAGDTWADDDAFWRAQMHFSCGTMDAYTASQLIAGLSRGNPAMDAAAVRELGDRLLQRGYFVAVMRKRGHTEAVPPAHKLGEGVFYKIVAEDDWRCLNGQCLVTGMRPDVMAVAVRLRGLLNKMHAAFVTDAGVDYRRMRDSVLYHEYRVAALDLQLLDVPAMGVHFRNNSDEALPFFVNVYNSLVIHASIQVGSPQSAMQRSSFFGKISYRIGEHKFSMNDLEHGVLRGNRACPGSLLAQFRRNDPRAVLSLERVDPRIHFALNCAAKSCPPIRVFSAKNIERGLQLAAEGFLRDTTAFDESSNTVTLSRILSWYRRDFPQRDTDFLMWICSFLDEGHALQAVSKAGTKVKFVFSAYDWSQNEVVKETDEPAPQPEAEEAMPVRAQEQQKQPYQQQHQEEAISGQKHHRSRGELIVDGVRMVRPPDVNAPDKTIDDLAEALQVTL